jgi:AraC-like DNA-binding protein
MMDGRMALAKAMLRRDTAPLEAVVAAIGYQSASAFQRRLSPGGRQPTQSLSLAAQPADRQRKAQRRRPLGWANTIFL